MTKRTCEHAGCNKPHRARGLCGTHYNQMHAVNRHKKKLIECVVCGARVERWGGGGRVLGSVCSIDCRTRAAAMLRGERTALPADHWARWYGSASPWPRYGVRACGWCGDVFVMKSARQACCSRPCTWRANKGCIGTAMDTLRTTRYCARCGEAYHHVAPNRKHCSDECRDRDADERGAHLHYGWIRPAARIAIYERDGYECQLCGEPVDMSADPRRDDWAPSLDHITPRSKGGTHDAANLRTAHRWCNAVRGDRDAHALFDLTA